MLSFLVFFPFSFLVFPFSRSLCPRWREVLAGSDKSLVGTYGAFILLGQWDGQHASPVRWLEPVVQFAESLLFPDPDCFRKLLPEIPNFTFYSPANPVPYNEMCIVGNVLPECNSDVIHQPSNLETAMPYIELCSTSTRPSGNSSLFYAFPESWEAGNLVGPPGFCYDVTCALPPAFEGEKEKKKKKKCRWILRNPLLDLDASPRRDFLAQVHLGVSRTNSLPYLVANFAVVPSFT